MKPFRVHKGLVAPLDRHNVDTDQIIPKQFLKRIERTGFGEFLFYDWRRSQEGKKDPAFVLDQRRYRGASILVAGKNFLQFVRPDNPRVGYGWIPKVRQSHFCAGK